MRCFICSNYHYKGFLYSKGAKGKCLSYCQETWVWIPTTITTNILQIQDPKKGSWLCFLLWCSVDFYMKQRADSTFLRVLLCPEQTAVHTDGVIFHFLAFMLVAVVWYRGELAGVGIGKWEKCEKLVCFFFFISIHLSTYPTQGLLALPIIRYCTWCNIAYGMVLQFWYSLLPTEGGGVIQ